GLCGLVPYSSSRLRLFVSSWPGVFVAAFSPVPDSMVPGGPSRTPLQVQTAERRHGQSQRVFEPVGGNGLAPDTAAVPDTGPAVDGAVAVEDFRVPARLGHANPVFAARHRREIEHHDDEIVRIARVPDDRDDAVLVVVA